jgi:hypothetical protein
MQKFLPPLWVWMIDICFSKVASNIDVTVGRQTVDNFDKPRGVAPRCGNCAAG